MVTVFRARQGVGRAAREDLECLLECFRGWRVLAPVLEICRRHRMRSDEWTRRAYSAICWQAQSGLIRSFPSFSQTDVQTSANLATRMTLGRVSNTQTNSSFTDLNTGTFRFYRLLVP